MISFLELQWYGYLEPFEIKRLTKNVAREMANTLTFVPYAGHMTCYVNALCPSWLNLYILYYLGKLFTSSQLIVSHVKQDLALV